MHRQANQKAAKAAKHSKVAAKKQPVRKIATKKVQKPALKVQQKASPITLAKRFGGGGGNCSEVINEHNADDAYKQKYGLYFSQQTGKDFTQFNSSNYDHNFEKYALAPHEQDHKTRNYMMMAGTKAAYIGLGRSVVHTVIGQLQASADVLAMASVEMELGNLEEGTTTTIKWRGKPVFIKNRTAEEIAVAVRDDSAEMRDKQNDADRVQKDNWLIVLGVCTHLGCVPIPNAGNHVGGFFCPCHGSHYDASGRIREGPAPLNLEVPGYKFITDDTVVIG